jgi:hypothetical protein
MISGHGPNIGHGYVKYVLIDDAGERELIAPAQIAPAQKLVAGSLATVRTIEMQGQSWWTGEDAQLAGSPITILAADRLTDPVFIPILVASAVQSFGHLNGSASGVCVTGLPATWAADTERAKELGKRLRDGHSAYTSIRVIPEPLGLIYAALLDIDGRISGDSALQAGTIGIVDIGHHTVDVTISKKMLPVQSSLDTWQLGTARALSPIRAQLAAKTERELSLFDTDRAIRNGFVSVAGRKQALPNGWDRPLSELADQIIARLMESWGNGSSLDSILIGGGGAELAIIVSAIQQRFPHARAIERPQTAIARGYARLARRYAGEAK